jgi:glycosyltransferase involved in cell wall biosynthesis
MPSHLALSVVVPVRNGAATLARALRAILASDLPRNQFELIVVDDGSVDGSATIAGRHADTVVRLSGQRSGLAYARNRGAELAVGDAVAFVDADVMVRADTLSRMLQTMETHPTLGAISARLDAQPAARNFFSQYWNLLVHFGEKWYSGIGGNFASRCGMIRRSVLTSAGMYDEWRFGAGTLEGVDFGQRLERAGHDVLLSPDFQVTHLKRWTARGVLREVWTRSALLSRSLGYQRTRVSAPSEVVFTLSRAAIPAFVILSTFALSAAFLPNPDWPVKVVSLGAITILVNLQVLRSYARRRGILFTLAAAPVHLFFQAVSTLGLCAGWFMRDAVGDRLPNAAIQAYSEVGLEMWPPIPRQQ